MLDLQPRPEFSGAHVEHLIRLTKAAELPNAERSLLLRVLKWLRLQSLGK